jgi:hypothetical protein
MAAGAAGDYVPALGLHLHFKLSARAHAGQAREQER